jgi:hypothetical protein
LAKDFEKTIKKLNRTGAHRLNPHAHLPDTAMLDETSNQAL